MFHLLFDVEFQLSPLPAPTRYRLWPFWARPEDCTVWSQYRILVEPHIIKVQSAVCSIAIVAHGPNEQGEDGNSALDEVLQEVHRFVVFVDAEEVKEFPGIIPDGPV